MLQRGFRFRFQFQFRFQFWFWSASGRYNGTLICTVRATPSNFVSSLSHATLSRLIAI